MLAIEFQEEKDELNVSSSDTSDVEEIGSSTPAKDQRKKRGRRRGRRNIKFGNLSGICEVRDSLQVFSDGEQSEVIKNEHKKPRLGGKDESGEESLGAIAALINEQEEVSFKDPGPGCSRDVDLDLVGGREKYGEVPPRDPEPPDETSTGVLKITGGGVKHEDVPLEDDVSHGDQEHVEDDEGQGSPRPSH